MHKRAAVACALCAAASAFLAGCYTDSNGRMHFGSAPRGPTKEQIAARQREQRLAELESRMGSLQSELDSVGTSVSSVATRSEDLSRATDARGADVVALRRDIDSISARLDSIESKMNALPGIIARAVDDGRAASSAEIKNAVADSESRMNRKISEASRSRASSGGSSSSSASGPLVSGEFYEHVVESGQTLSEIARAYGVTQNEIIKATGIKDASKLRVGQKLYIPAK